MNESYRTLFLQTKNGELQTPFFMPDATRATVRGMTTQSIEETGIEALVVNTYHLLLQPGSEIIEDLKGIHAFMRWDKPILSDSGGYQVYSLIHKNPEMGYVTEEEVVFFSPLDGKEYRLTPERSIAIQFELGVDMMVCLDDPRPNTATKEDIDRAVERSIRWAVRCKEEYKRQIKERGLGEKEKPLLFGVVQGGPYKDLRKRSADALVEISFDGYGFGARHVDEKGVFMEEIMAYTASLLPEDVPHFALGVGTPFDIVRSYLLGWDMFDCVIPTREGRHGRIFRYTQEEKECSLEDMAGKSFWYETINIRKKENKEEKNCIEKNCNCHACANGYSLAYIRHLFRVGESLGPQLLSAHNLHFYARLMKKIKDRRKGEGLAL